jgi:RNA-directed DNA polymerase
MNGMLFQQVTALPSLHTAWRKVRANRGAAGIDAVSLHTFEANLAANLQELARCLVSRSYQPLPARFVTVTKENGKERELAILAVRDRVAQRAVLDVIEPLIEPLLLDCSFAFRAGRNCEMAVQRLLAARANGFWWTVESDVQDFFPSVDRRLLLNDLTPVINDAEVLRLLRLWLDAGALEPQDAGWAGGLMRQGRELVASLQLQIKDAVSSSVDDFVAERLGVAGGWEETGPPSAEDWAAMQQEAAQQARQASLKRIVQDGALLAWSHRGLLAKVLGPKVLGVGGVAVAAAMLAPKALSLYRNYTQEDLLGTLQGAPISPLLTNFYLTPFDQTLTQQGWRLLRYCDDFVIQCRTETEARAALQAAEQAARERRLTLHPDKTRIVPPDGAFEFLGYSFTADGRVIPPPTVPEQMARHIRQLAQRAARWRKK